MKSAELASVPEFLKWDENFKGNSENLILKKLSNIASGKRCIEKRHVDDILDVFKTMYLDTGKFEVAIEQQKQYAIRRVAGKYKTDVEIYPLSACGFYNSKAPSGFNKGELPSGVLFGVIGTIAGRIKNHAVDEVFLHFHKRLVDEFKVYLVGDLMHRAFVNDEWSKNTFKKTGYDFDSIGSVRLARFFLMGQDERQKLVNEKSRGVSAAKTASEFFDSIYHLAEMELRSIEENNRSYSAYSWLDEILKPRELVLLKEPNTGSGVYRVYSEYLEAFLSTDAVLSMFQKVLSSVKSIDELLAWHIEKSELPGWAYGRFSEKNEIAAIDIFRSLMRANYDDGYAEKEYTNPLYSVLLNAESIDIVSRVLLLSVASYPNAGFFRNEVVPYIRKMPKTPDTQKAFLWAVAEALGGCQTVDDVMKRILDSYQKREKESSWQYVDRSSKERIQNEEAYPIALEAFMDTDDGKCAKELLDADAFDITDFDYAMASFFLDAISDFQAEQKRYNNR